ncbi:hypothetical protein [Shewanella jiangmenensis]|nr:hypothetical protein [Shewanella jiangmenensis]
MLSLSLLSAWYFGTRAFAKGMGVKRWACIGAAMGPVAYPLFTTHKRLMERKAGLYGERCIGL